MTKQTKLTEDLLLEISKHLSGRPDCSKLEYVLEVTNRDTLKFWPEIKIFPNIYNRKPTAKVNVLYHIVTEHYYKEIYNSMKFDGSIIIKQNSLVPGKYIYKLSVNRKKRRWERMD